MFWLIIFSLVAASAVRGVLGLYQNRKVAQRSGLPYVLFPVPVNTVFYASLFENRLVPYVVNKWLPRDLADYINGSLFKRRWAVRDRLAKKYGNVYLLVTPTKLGCHVSDASVISQIYAARRSFPKPVQFYKSLEMFGPNVLTCEDQQWSRHRRYTAMTFTEKNNALVWHESIRLVTEMKDYWEEQYTRSSQLDFVLPDSREDFLKLTLDVICGGGFGVKLPFKPSSQAPTEGDAGLFKDAATPPPNYHFTFRSVMEYMNRNLILVYLTNFFLPKWIPRAVLPSSKTAHAAHRDLSSYLRALLSTAGIGETNAHNLLEGLLKSRRREEGTKHAEDAEAHSTHDSGLSDDEILGNLYIFTLAGHETTATTLRFAFVLLALHPDIQDELYHGIREATKDESSNPAEWDYGRVFPKLVEPLCVMLETLRLYPPVVSVPKSTSSTPCSILYQNQSYVIPPSISVTLNANASHYSEEYWGPDAAQFDPRRWDKRNAESFLAKNDKMEGLLAPGLEYANIHKPVRGAFIGFSDGFRACIGKKFAQVEFVVTLALIFGEYRVDLAKVDEHETDEDARHRAQEALDDSTAFITLTMKEAMPLLFQRRSSATNS